uniref:Uncharacterized protein n=1 Tax=Arundo donax TaxID=35708 RepID=A0A0A9BA24_ARUDO
MTIHHEQVHEACNMFSYFYVFFYSIRNGP